MKTNNLKQGLLISIITIVYNGVEEIENTIKSVISQTYSDIEYIIIDGGSKDGTVDILKKYDSQITYWHSKEDSGIYDAMNIGNNIATGDYIFFLNSGDFFTCNEIVELINKDAMKHNYSLLTGRTKIYYNGIDLGIVSPPLNVQLSEKSPAFSHQATFIHRSIYKNFSYNTTYSISADKEYWYKVKKIENFSVLFYDLNIASFGLGGVSNNHKNVLNRRLEDFYIEYKYEGINFLKFSKMIFKTILTYFITLNEDFYFRKIYVAMNKFKERR